MKKILTIALVIFSLNCIAQEQTIKEPKPDKINPKGKWFFGAEIGTNTITSLYSTTPKLSFQGGVSAEYYFARHWSLSTKIKYFETGLAFDQKREFIPGGPGFNFFGGTSGGRYLTAGSGTFSSKVLCIPLFLKWEFRLFKNLSVNGKAGGAYTIETQSDYKNFTVSAKTYSNQNYWASSYGGGLNYFISKKVAIYFDYERFEGVDKIDNPDFSTLGKVSNTLTNFGVKYSFK